MSNPPRAPGHPPPADEDGFAIRRLGAVDAVRARVLLALEIGSLAPGDRLGSARELAAGLDVSPITARRAMESLVNDGVLIRKRGAGGGTFVADHPTCPGDEGPAAYRADTGHVLRLIERRALMEAGLAALAAIRRDQDDLDRIGGAVEACAQAAEWSAFHGADRAFHLAIAAAAREPADEHLALYSRLTAYFVPYPIEHLHGSNEEHAAILGAIRARDAGTAARLASAHVAALREDMFIARERPRPA